MKRIAILGAYGTVGREALQHLYSTGDYELYGLVRQPERVKEDPFFDAMPDVRWERLDITENERLTDAICGMDVVLNTVSCSGKYSRKIAELCAERNTAYVDAGIPDDIGDLSGQSDKTLLYGAGALPGLSSVLGVYAAQGFDTVSGYQHIASIHGAFSYGAAYDYLRGVSGKYGGHHVKKTELPLLGCTEIMQYTDDETHYVLQKIGCPDGKHYVTLGSRKLYATIERAVLRFESDPEGAARELVTYSQLYRVRSQEHMAFIIEVQGTTEQGIQQTRTLLMKYDSAAALTGLSAGLSTEIAANASQPIGVCSLTHFPDDPLYAKEMPRILRAIDENRHKVVFETCACSINEWMQESEGEI